MIYVELFLGFLQVGCFAFGGGYGAIPLIREVVLSYGWLTDETLAYMIAISESSPGPIMVNLATYVGTSQAGIVGAILATFAVVLPAFLIVLLIMVVFDNVIQNRYVQAILGGLRPCIIGIILATGIYMIISNCISWSADINVELKYVVITAILLVIMTSVKWVGKRRVSPILLIVLSAGLGIVIF